MSTKPFYKHELTTKLLNPKVETVKRKNYSSKDRLIEDNDEEGNFHVQKVDRSIQLRIQQERAKKGLTQGKLALAACIPEHIIKSYENGSAVVKQAEVNKIAKALGLEKL